MSCCRYTRSARSERFAVGVLIVIVTLLSFAPAAAAEPKPRWNFRAGGEVGTRYDDNIISLSEQDQAFLEANPAAGKDRFGVETPDDLILIPEMSFALTREPDKGLETGLAFVARGYEYLDNPVKSYESLSLTMRQDLTTSRKYGTRLSMGLSYIPDYFVRRLVDEDATIAAGTTVRNDVTYEKLQARMAVSQEVVRRLLDVEASYTWADRDYNDNFNERDSRANVFGLELRSYPLRRNALLVRPYYENESRDAVGDVQTLVPLADDDVGYDSDLYGLDLRWLWGRDREHRNSLTVFYEYESRDYASTDPLDLGHYGRKDQIDKYGVTYMREFGPEWDLLVSGYDRENEVSFPDGRSTPYPKLVVTATVGYRFGGAL